MGLTDNFLSRRAFLRRGTLTAAAVGVAGTALPGLSGLLATGASEAPAVEPAAGEVGADAVAGSMTGIALTTADVEA